MQSLRIEEAAFTPEARVYAVHELAIRSGVDKDFLSEWRVHALPEETVVDIGNTGARVRFPHQRDALCSQAAKGEICVTRAKWSTECKGAEEDLAVGFCRDMSAQPLFLFRGKEAQCTVDLLPSILLTLSRFEEQLTTTRDHHGRFAAAQSIAWRYGFLDRPVIDEFGMDFEQVLRRLISGFAPKTRTLKIKVSHDVEDTGIQFRWRTTLGHTLRRLRFDATARDLAAWLRPILPTFLHCIVVTKELAKCAAVDSAFYWKASPRSEFDSGYDPLEAKTQRVLRWLTDGGTESGVHPGYRTFHNLQQLEREVEVVRRAVGDSELGGRQHYLRWDAETWLQWERCGLKYDSTVGYADHIGFRAGTCYPYRPWIVTQNRTANLLEIPLLVMDGSLVAYMGLRGKQFLQTVLPIVQRCRSVGGVFSFLFHPGSLLHPAYDGMYESILDAISDTPSCDWKQELQQQQKSLSKMTSHENVTAATHSA